MRELSYWTIGTVVAAAALGHWWWRREKAREIVERWMERHRYRIVEVRRPWFSLPRFGPSLWRDSDDAFEFRVTVQDLRLGGTGILWARVWADWLGMIEKDVEISWERMPDAGAGESDATESRWSETQLALLQQAADGQESFRPDGNDAAARAAFDEVVEHILALNRRGLVRCSPPVANVRGAGQYEMLTGVRVTSEGQVYLAQHRASRDRG